MYNIHCIFYGIDSLYQYHKNRLHHSGQQWKSDLQKRPNFHRFAYTFCD
jgi:hypothetical protein